MPFLNIEGGKIPKSISLKAPPPTAVIVPKVTTPSKSNLFLKATMTPDMVNAIIPIISIIKISIPNSIKLHAFFKYLFQAFCNSEKSCKKSQKCHNN